MADSALPPLTTSSTVFVGNIPFDATEQQVRDILTTVGPLKKFRLVPDPTTGKPKGFGFAEYFDSHTAQSAIRNLHNTEINGRPLRVDVADDDKPFDQRVRKAPSSAPLTSSDSSASSASHARFTLASSSSPHPPGPLTPDSITALLTSLTPQQRAGLLVDVRQLIDKNPAAATQLLHDHPALTHLLLQLQLLYGLTTRQEVEALTVPPAGQHPPPMPQLMQQAVGYQQPPQGFYPPQVPQGMPSPDEILARLPPLPPHEREILVELLKLTPEELKLLPPEAQQQVKGILQGIGIGR